MDTLLQIIQEDPESTAHGEPVDQSPGCERLCFMTLFLPLPVLPLYFPTSSCGS